MRKVVGILFLLCNFSYAQKKIGIQGIVYDAATGEVLAGAELEIIGIEHFEITSKEGRYLFSDLKKGTYTITVSYVGYTPQKKKVTLNNKSVTQHFRLQEMSTELDEVVVTGTGTMHHIQAVPLMTEVIGKKFLSMYSGQSLQEILAGLSPSFDYNESVMGANIQMNGLGSKYILILVNGERISDEQNVLGVINPAEIEKIEIVKGASSSLYGSDAIAGVVNIITKKEKAKIALQNSTRYANYNTLHQTNKVSLAKGKFRSTTRFNLKHTDGWQNTKEEIYRGRPLYTNSNVKTVNRFTDWKIGQQVKFIANKKFTADVEGSYYNKNIIRPVGGPQGIYYNMEYQNQSYSARAKYKLNKKINFSVNANYNQTVYLHHITSIDYSDDLDENGKKLTYPIGTTLKEYKNEQLLADAKTIFKHSKKGTLSAGLQAQNAILTAPTRLPSGKESSYTLSAYVQEEYNLTEDFNLTGGLRVTKNEFFGTNVTPKVSVLKKCNKFNFRASWSLGFKTPTIKEMHYRYKRGMGSMLSLYLGNDQLKPETSNYFSLATEYKTTNFSCSLTAYLNKLKDMINMVEIRTPYEEKIKDREIDRTLQYQNIDNAQVRGIETILKYTLSPNIRLGASYSYLDAKGKFYNEETKEIEDREINYTSKHKGSVYALWNHSWEKYVLGIGFFGRGQSKRYHYEYGNADAYMLFRLNTEHKFLNFKNYNIEVNAGIDNLLDYKETKPFGYHYATKTSGRTFYVSLFINFKK